VTKKQVNLSENQHSGKTTFLQTVINDKFIESTKTIEIDLANKNIKFKDKTLSFQIWDHPNVN
jgi:GTPase SAR1 family protein